MQDLHQLFIHELELMYDAEQQLAKAFPKIIAMTPSEKLRKIFINDLKETEIQVSRLEKIFQEIHHRFSGLTCDGMKDLLHEADKIIQSNYESIVKDVALINCARRVEHFKIASYGILKSLARNFEYKNILKLLEESSKEEGNAHKKLLEIAEETILHKDLNMKDSRRHSA